MGTKEGVIKVRDVRKHGIETDKWNLAQFNAFQGVPWEPIPGREGIELKCRVNMPRDSEGVTQPMEGQDSDLVHRRVRITREQVRLMGFTVGCPGCRAVNRWSIRG